jgi:hypothetical protein
MIEKTINYNTANRVKVIRAATNTLLIIQRTPTGIVARGNLSDWETVSLPSDATITLATE